LVLNEPVLLSAAQQLSAQGLEPRAWSAAFTYASDGLMAEAEVNHVSSNRPFQPTTWAGGLTLGYHLGQVAPYVVFARASSKVNPPIDLGTLPSIPALRKYPAAVTYLMALNVKNQSTVSLGVRWDWAPNVALKGQVDRIHAHDSEALWTSYQPGWGGNATIVSVCLDFVFGGGRR
jgi:hypothetical protein